MAPLEVSRRPLGGQVTYVVVAKAPVPGQVKTRLTPAFSDHEAAALAAAALLDTLDAVRSASTGRGVVNGAHSTGPDGLAHSAGHRPPVVALAGDLDRAAAGHAVRSACAGFRIIAQRGEGFAARLGFAHADAGGAGATVQVGMDTPQVSATALRAAGEQVLGRDGPDAVLGPAEDGGWWLLALRCARDARLLATVPMSCPETGRLTLEALAAAGLRVALADPLRDVDEPTDVPLVAAAAPGTRFAALAQALGTRGATR